MSATENERPQRVLAMAQAMVKAAEAMERSDWKALEHIARELARQSRVLSMLDREEKTEGAD